MIMIMIMIMIRVILISQIGLDPATGELVEGVAQQTEVSLRNMMAIMEVGMSKILVMIHCAMCIEGYCDILTGCWGDIQQCDQGYGLPRRHQ